MDRPIGGEADGVPRRRRRPVPYPGQRALDLVVCAVAAVQALLLVAVAALAVRLTSRGPVFFTQERVGMDGRPFVMVKLRTMVHRPQARTAVHDEKLVTPVGRVLRKFSLDELPQLYNVLRGEMSIVGPRPTVAYQVEQYDDRQRRRLLVRPGLTGLAGVSGRNGLTWAERIVLDLEYVERQSLWFDLSILLRTPRVLLFGVGVGEQRPDDPLARLAADDE